MQLLTADGEGSLEGFEIFGIIKETGVDDEGLMEFQKDYFPVPLYRDETWGFYHAFGDISITAHLSFNPFKIWKMSKRLKDKKLEGNIMKGEGLKTGGIIIFGVDGEPKYMYPEITGSSIEVDDLLAAVEAVRGLVPVPIEL